MTTKERLHELVDELSELEADDALRILIARRKNGAGDDDQPDDEGPIPTLEGENESEHEWAMEFLRALDAGEIDGYDFSVSEQLHAER